MLRRPPISTRTYTRFPFTTFFLSAPLGLPPPPQLFRHPRRREAQSSPPRAQARRATSQRIERLPSGACPRLRAAPPPLSAEECPVRTLLRQPRERGPCCSCRGHRLGSRSEEHTSELQSLMRISYAVFCLKKKT